MINVRDFEAVRGVRPFLVAHRGGVITPNAPENSLRAIGLAAEHGYAMAELDVMESADGVPVLMHDALFISCGEKRRVCELTCDELTKLQYRASNENVITFERAVAACAELGLGIMLDKLRRDSDSDPEMSGTCLDRVAGLICEAGLAESTVAIVDSPHLRRHLGAVSLFQVKTDDFNQILQGKRIALDGQYWFGWAVEISREGIECLHENGAFAIVSINTFHYPPHAPDLLARQDIERLLAAGMDGFQIDSVYEHYLVCAPGK
jgi:hypothetical protein